MDDETGTQQDPEFVGRLDVEQLMAISPGVRERILGREIKRELEIQPQRAPLRGTQHWSAGGPA